MVYLADTPRRTCSDVFPVELHSQSKSNTPDAFKYYPSISEDELPIDLPPEHYRQLCTLLPHFPPNKIVKGLVHAHRDTSGHLVYGPPVQNRPWEWVENLGEPALEDDANRWEEKPFKNASSLSLELFAARQTGDHITRPSSICDATKHDDNEGNDMRLEGDMRSFEDGLSAESIYRRDWRETRLEAYREGHMGGGALSAGKGDGLDGVNSLSVFPTQHRAGSAGAGSGSRRASPASSVKSKGSAPGTASSARQSPGSTNKMSTASDMMEEDRPMPKSGLNSGDKRKANSDDEVEVVEGPSKVDAKRLKSVKARGRKR